ncbi:MAG: hypothetical protein NTX15_04960 [Candidatus Kapabacteria bacterium]|nr:hypothetical protein [Candidatus Kapabacteria bacterium]
MKRVLETLVAHNYLAYGAITDQKALDMIHTAVVDAIVFGGGVEGSSVDVISAEAIRINSQTMFILANPQTVLTDLQRAFSQQG